MANTLLLKALGVWLEPTRKWYAVHLKSCKALDIEPTPFGEYAEDVLNTPEKERDWLLADEDEAPAYQPTVRFRQYDSPLQSEMATGLFYRDYRKGKK